MESPQTLRLRKEFRLVQRAALPGVDIAPLAIKPYLGPSVSGALGWRRWCGHLRVHLHPDWPQVALPVELTYDDKQDAFSLHARALLFHPNVHPETGEMSLGQVAVSQAVDVLRRAVVVLQDPDPSASCHPEACEAYVHNPDLYWDLMGQCQASLEELATSGRVTVQEMPGASEEPDDPFARALASLPRHLVVSDAAQSQAAAQQAERTASARAREAFDFASYHASWSATGTAVAPSRAPSASRTIPRSRPKNALQPRVTYDPARPAPLALEVEAEGALRPGATPRPRQSEAPKRLSEFRGRASPEHIIVNFPRFSTALEYDNPEALDQEEDE
ncbi:uncharacterized protein MONBRDRAFT_38858 [Monosiga brevicollis MX1]|uniref:Uncharacterized protein n=1 Tax=Monosiga brevicollis TaxID=81824 RepID=A9VAK8_MONBE|nr:uncharacterized protein MONBRDRAFT_38858 [Monosiga brevicollis MX1]EDQ85391.1 predicted protein [Monosiga brevicollis MX1]|eukprot:XP_001749802.1 hypothetical protein [Monosiga brevicollis MX1]